MDGIFAPEPFNQIPVSQGLLTELELDTVLFGSYQDISPGSYLKLSVRDTGEGISPEILGKIFNSYFTTKEKGVGTGLGLSMVHGIVQKCGGTIKVNSELGKGSVFEVYLPAIS